MNTASILAFSAASFGCALALSVALRGQRSLSHWAFVAGMMLLAAKSFFSGLTARAATPEAVVNWHQWQMLVSSLLPGVWLLFSASYSRGNALDVLRKWGFLLAGAFLLPAVLAVVGRGELISSIEWDILEDHWVVRLGMAGNALHMSLVIGAVLVLMNLERTFRASVGTMRWRIKYMILGLGLLFTVQLYTSSQALLFRGVDLGLEPVKSGALIVACLLMLRSLLRAGHFDVQVYPSQLVLHNSLTVLLAGIYLLVVGVFAKVAMMLGGDAAFTLVAFLVLVALVLLAVLLLSDRARLYTRRFVSRHFQRPLHDYRKVWHSFAAGTASCVEQTTLCRTSAKLVADIFQVLAVTIWLVDDRKERLTFAASTFLSESKGRDLEPPNADSTEAIRALQTAPEPVDLDASKFAWAAALRGCHPQEFQKGGSRLCVPLMGGGTVLGVMTLGDRVGGVAFSLQDFDLLTCVGSQVGASLLNVQLAHKLVQAKELEAFQTMSAFFVHDLKNTASTLNLMLQNLPVHFDNPAFREDALRGIEKTATHINNLISRLGLLRHDLKISPSKSDLNEVVAQALAGWEKTADVDLVKDPHPLPPIQLDQEQMLKVVTNLVLNAREAVVAGGQVRVATSQQTGWAVLTVADNGCGMTPEFLRRSLFRPFQTTKKSGLGIGMFQSKMIVEAHGGRMEVESEVGKGTTFRVLLPQGTHNQ